MSFFHNSKTSKSPITRKVSRKKVPKDGEKEGKVDDERSPSPNGTASNPASPNASREDVGETETGFANTGLPPRKNEHFEPKVVPEGEGAFEEGRAEHSIDSKKDYELCKEQVEQGHDRDKIMEHFKLVKELKPLDAPASMEKEIDATESQT